MTVFPAGKPERRISWHSFLYEYSDARPPRTRTVVFPAGKPFLEALRTDRDGGSMNEQDLWLRMTTTQALEEALVALAEVPPKWLRAYLALAGTDVWRAATLRERAEMFEQKLAEDAA